METLSLKSRRWHVRYINPFYLHHWSVAFDPETRIYTVKKTDLKTRRELTAARKFMRKILGPSKIIYCAYPLNYGHAFCVEIPMPGARV